VKTLLLIAFVVLVAGCTIPGSDRVVPGDTVSVYYTLKVDNAVIDSNVGKTPLTFKVGSGEMIKGFDLGVVGMAVGEERTFSVSPADGYGTSGNHPLAGKTLAFTVKIAEIKK